MTQTRALEAVRRTHSLPVEMLLLAAVVLVWQFARVPFESSVAAAIANSDRLIDAEQTLGVLVEPRAIRAFAAHPALLDAANWFYSHMDETLVFGAYAALRLIEPVRFAAMRTAFAIAHLPAILVVAVFPAAPPRWVPRMPFGAPPAFGIGGDLRNSTAAAVSLHVGIPVLIAASAIWARPRAPLAWATVLYPTLVATVWSGPATTSSRTSRWAPGAPRSGSPARAWCTGGCRAGGGLRAPWPWPAPPRSPAGSPMRSTRR